MTHDPIRIRILYFSVDTCKTTFNIFIKFKTKQLTFSCRCFLNHSPLINGYAKALPYHLLASNWLCLCNVTVIRHFNKVYFSFRRRGLKLFKLLRSDCQYCRLMVMCIDLYMVKFSITMHRCTAGSSLLIENMKTRSYVRHSIL